MATKKKKKQKSTQKVATPSTNPTATQSEVTQQDNPKSAKPKKSSSQSGLAKFWADNKVNLIGWTVVVFILAIFFGIVTYTNQQTAQRLSEITMVYEDDNIKGDVDGENVVIEYADFGCPGCASFASYASQLVEDDSIEGGVKVIFRHFPILGANSVQAAIATEAAANQDKFWEMHDQLFLNQAEWRAAANKDEVIAFFVDYAEEIELDLEKFRADMDDTATEERVNEEAAQARSIYLNSTPSIFINGEAVNLEELTNGYESLAEIINNS